MSNFSQFERGLKKHILKTFARELKLSEAEEEDIIATHLQKDLSDTTLIRSKKEIKIKFPNLRTEAHLVKYSILSWFMGPLTRFELQEILRTKAVAQRYEKVEVYLHSYETCAAALFLEIDYKLNDVFGNILQRKILEYTRDESGRKYKREVNDTFSLYLVELWNPKSTQRKRGYNDHGSSPTTQEKFWRQTNKEYGEMIHLQVELNKHKFLHRSHNRVLEVTLRMEGIR